MQISLDKKNILITGGTGSFGTRCLQMILKNLNLIVVILVR